MLIRATKLLSLHFTLSKGANFCYRFLENATDFWIAVKYLLFKGMLE